MTRPVGVIVADLDQAGRVLDGCPESEVGTARAVHARILAEYNAAMATRHRKAFQVIRGQSVRRFAPNMPPVSRGGAA